MDLGLGGQVALVAAASRGLGKPADIERAVGETLEAYGQIDILIANSGGPRPGEFLDLAPSDWEAAFQLTLMSAIRLCYAVIPHMLERGSGSIIASEAYLVKEPAGRLMLSNSLRLAVIGMMKTLANELGPKGIRVNTINPGWTWTDRVQHLMADRAQANATSADDEAKKITNTIPLGRMGTVEEYGKTIAWLASPAAAYIHGHALMFDGGIIKAAL